ncbi:FAD-binding oxidoreductase [bacterium]|nr:FAD-binding oxidoreductase [bacterium]
MQSLGHIVVIGGGIAGASSAYYLAASGRFDRVSLLEAEAQLAHHTTGRSAALLIENYGAGPVRPLTTASLDFFHSPPADLVDHPVIEPRGIMTIATRTADYDLLDEQLADGAHIANPVVELPLDQAAEISPHIVFGPEHRVMWEHYAHSIDVAGVHQAYVRGLKRAGGEIHTSRRVDAARPSHHGWLVETTTGDLQADIVVNAAGAWGDVVAVAAGIAPVGLQPLKRTAFMVPSPFAESASFPFVADVQHAWYLGPDGSQFLCSPADETPSEPCDARADEVDIARTIDKLNVHTRLGIRSVASHWAGLRTFAPDRAMVIGPDPDQPNFIWCVGQGGTGIQTSPGAGRLVADLTTTGTPSAHFAETGLDTSALAPGRLR